MIKSKETRKKEYVKPQLRIVSIAPGVQTLGTGCKLSVSTIGLADQLCHISVCSTQLGS